MDESRIKEILKIDICGRIPFGVKILGSIHFDGFTTDYIAEVIGVCNDIVIHKPVVVKHPNLPSYTSSQIEIENCRPILFTMDDISNIQIDGDVIDARKFTECPDIMNEYHVDYRRLNERDLAVPVYKLNNNPYNS